mmetsp:Transcript_2800/g.4230  ORF Transcript_2800/g.4230 Transcript_2800/m.4230 type:complete len:481 (+) Transcript_2800:127-1569(+)|eukprot:CAMPEP_0185026842 /NCGR_PEP_ID=MMETSP1103-20130426/11353_1 /TAXON_ID=36769 /ORGANISM="Paraphysomonas bandaiensis, Strain Caron Lab Isolate" /LENGTH=480 /DNA_ID=CAMNT_0027560563 /DNA_START=44 /DNA_END=1486 /DNA_ORIENTATION=+
MSAKPKKYIFVNGVMKLNPEYSDGSSNATPAAAPNQQPLAVISSMADVQGASEAQSAATGAPLQLSESTVAAMEIMQDDEYTNNFGASVDGSMLLDQLTEYFVQYEVPVGLVNKLMALQFYRLNFIVDDSGSMKAPSDVLLSEGTPHLLRGVLPGAHDKMTRWQEAENRLHIMMDILSYIPTKTIEIRFLNAKQVIVISRNGKSPEVFRQEAHEAISNAFTTIDVRYKTPTHKVLTRAFETASSYSDPTMHYLLTDGVPSDAPTEVVAALITNRPNPQMNPLTLISCTNEDDEVEWMKQVEEVAPFTAELDDFHDEKDEVLTDQGTGFPYTRGFWMISQLVAAINPDDLDAIDENLPFTKNTLDNLLGRTHTPQEYQYYFEKNPHAPLYVDVYPRFLNEQVFARQIVSVEDQRRREMGAGYKDGKKPSSSFSPKPIAHLLTPHTNAAAGGSALPGGGTGVFNIPSAAPPPYAGPPPSYGS